MLTYRVLFFMSVNRLQMVKELAQVVSVDNSFAWLEPVAKSGCQSCDANQTCGTGLLSQILGRKSFLTKVENTLDVCPGEQVIVSIPQKGLFLASVIMYFIPIFSLFLFAVGGSILGWSETLVVTSAFIGLIVGFFGARFLARLMARSSIAQIKMLSKSSENIVLQIE